MIVKRVTRVALTRTTEANSLRPRVLPATELWRVEWTEVRDGKADELAQSHFTEAAGRRHVEGLLSMRAPGLSVDSVYTERIDRK
ncbi:hypothetical protein [Mycobacterium sp.]|uniref:hypothetical protein n=1 Tax=Mycobacterium sp. TaxID=1785 RepID=UPI00257CD2C9|nr:hypothetical protein [Mycobacterium sp.]